MRPGKTIGFDRRIDIAWLDAVAGQVASGIPAGEIRTYLKTMLGPVVAGDSSRAALGKTVTTLVHLWVLVPPATVPLRDRAAQLLPHLDPDQRLAVHWAMAVATYPFFMDVAAGAGRLIGLQGQVNLAQLTRRLAEGWGDRSTMQRAAQRIVRSMVQWGALRDGPVRGTYLAPPNPTPVSGEVSDILIEALLLATDGNRLPVGDVLSNPAMFPFRIDTGMQQLRQRFTVSREGVDIVELR